MIDRLRELVGEDVVSEGDFSPFRVHGRTPSAVVSPWNAEQAAAVLRVCSENDWTVEPAGAGSWLDWGLPPERVDVLITTERMAGVSDYEPADLTISVAAGTPLVELAETVTADRQMLAFDPPSRPGATIGAAIALASAGPLRLAHGTPRDQVLGLEMVTGDGRTVKLGGRVVKNVAGYDLVRLAVGSRGTLGLITHAHVRLRPAPEHEVTAIFTADDAGQLIEDVYAAASKTWPAAIELLSPPTAAALGRPRRWALAVRCRGNHAFVAEAQRRLAAFQALPAEVLHEADAARFWDSLANLEARAALAVRFASLPTRLARLLRLALAAPSNGASADAFSDPGDDWMVAAHAGNGIVRLWRVDEPDASRVAELAINLGAAREELSADGGTVTAPLFRRTTETGFDPFGHPGPVAEIMRGIRKVFDPAGILSRGRFLV